MADIDSEWVSDTLKCPICFLVLKHTFCQACIIRCLQVRSQCPLCRTPIADPSVLKVNRIAASMVQEQTGAHAAEYKKRAHLAADAHTLDSASPGRLVRLSMTKNYAAHWGTRQGVRECVQNWYDGLQEHPSLQALRSRQHPSSFSSSSFFSLLDAPALPSSTRSPYMNSDSGFFPVEIMCTEEVHTRDDSAPPGAPTPATHRMRYTAKYAGQELGWLTYDGASTTISYCNYDVSLKRQILLLGYSTKTKKQHLVGQFGEGMKVGILALLRAGKGVCMRTNHERWTFFLGEDENFGSELVLSVIVEPEEEEEGGEGKRESKAQEASVSAAVNDFASLSISSSSSTSSSASSFSSSSSASSHHTITTITGLGEAEWRAYERDFLFLRPPADFVNTPSGTLLLEAKHKHRLYVKGFWIADLESEGLLMGVNLYDMELDRDRRAVVKRSEIEMKVSHVWTHAILQRSDLVPVYFDMLMQDSQMVRQGILYITDRGIELLAAHFAAQHGPSAFPVCVRVGADEQEEGKKVARVEEEMHVRSVRVPDALYSILARARNLQTLETLENAMHGQLKNRPVPTSLITKEQQLVLARACTLLQHAVDSSLASRGVQVWEFADEGTELVIPQEPGAPVRVNRQILDLEHVHLYHQRCTSLAPSATSRPSEPSSNNRQASSSGVSDTGAAFGLVPFSLTADSVGQVLTLASLLSPDSVDANASAPSHASAASSFSSSSSSPSPSSSSSPTIAPASLRAIASFCACRELRLASLYVSAKATQRAKNPVERAAFERMMTERMMHALLSPLLRIADTQRQ